MSLNRYIYIASRRYHGARFREDLMSTKELKGYWGGVRNRMVHRLMDNHSLEALVVKRGGYNRNVRGLSCRVKDGHLVAHNYSIFRARKPSPMTDKKIDPGQVGLFGRLLI